MGQPALAQHRPRRKPLLGGGRNSRRPAHLLCRRRVGRCLEDHRWRHQLAVALRRPDRAVHRLHRRGALRQERRLGGDGRREDPQPHLRGAGRLQVHRRGRDLDTHRPREDGAHPAHRRASAGSQHGARLRARPCLRPAAGARRVSHHRRRRHVDARAVRGREHGLLRHRDGSVQPARALRRHVAAGDSHVRTHERRPRQRTVRVARRRHHVDASQGERPTHQAGGEGGGGDRHLESAARLRDDRDGRRHSVERRAHRERPAVAIGRRRPPVGAHQPRPQRDGARALLLAHGRGHRRRGRDVLPHGVVLQVH